MASVNERRRPSSATQEARSRPALSRDPDGVERIASSWESLVERLIREAQEDGRFDDLPGQGEPLVLADDAAAGDQALAYHVLRNARVAPPWIEADKEVRALEDEIEHLLARTGPGSSMRQAGLARRLDELIDEHDRAVARLASLAPSSRLQRRRLDRSRLHARLGPDHLRS
jgi:hypothetical protein